MKCRTLAASLTAYLDGELDDATASACRGHLRTCEACRVLAEDHARIRDELAGLERVEPPAALWGAIRERLGEAEIADARRRPAMAWWARTRAKLRPIVWPAALTASACAIAILVVQWRRAPEGQPVLGDASRAVAAAMAAPRVEVPLRDATAELADEDARVEERFRKTAAELLALARAEVANGPDADARAFALEVERRQKAVLAAARGRDRDRAWHALLAYLEDVVMGERVAMADVGGAR